MNITKVENILKENFTNHKLLQDNIFRATKEINNKIYQVHYVDLTQKLFEPGFDLENYQRKLLVKDYYFNEGPIQWNFYLHFLIDEDNLAKNNSESIKYRIETDRKLARKTIFTIDEFDKYLSPIKTNINEVPKDIVDLWKDFLRPELHTVLDDSIPMKDVINLCLNNRSTGRTAPRSSFKNIDPFPLINKFKIIDYRKFPKRKNYEFGMINLIIGPNAVGKTSLLEALELSVCGKTIRSPDIDEPFNFEITPFDTSKPVKIEKESDETYRSRDYRWYGRKSTRGNFLHSSFARFNFFDADAAVHFSERTEEHGGISKALTQVVYGPDADKLFDRIKTIKTHFEDERRNLERAINTDDERKIGDEEELKSKIKADTGIISEELISDRLKSLNIIIENYNKENLESTIVNIAESNIFIASWRTAVERFGIEDYASFNKIETNIIKAAQDLTKHSFDHQTIADNEEKLEVKIQELTNQLISFKRLARYTQTGAHELQSLNITLATLDDSLQTLEKTILLYKSVDRDKLKKYMDCTISQAKEEINNSLTEIKEKESINQQRLLTLKTNLDKCSFLIKEIQSKGRDLVQFQSEINECPLCKTDLKPETLSNRLEKPLTSIESSRNDVDSLIGVISRIDNDRTLAEETLSSLDLLEQTLESTLSEVNIHSKISLIIGAYDKLKDEQSQMKTEHEIVARKLDKFKDDGYSSEELNNLIQDSETKINDDNLPESIQTKITKLSTLLDEQIKLLNKSSEDKKILSSKILRIQEINNALKNTTTHNVEQVIDEFMHLYADVKNIELITPLLPTDTTDSVERRLSQATELISSYLKNSAVRHSMNDLKKSLEKINSRIKANQEQLGTTNECITSLGELIHSLNPEKLLKEFMKNYSKLISNIFNQIHSPREFDGVILDNGKIYAKRRTTDDNEPLNRLSTGQRTAFVLSVFLAMNKVMENGPRLLIFDDPVTYVDDLNILSFLDYLQKIALESNRQIFFATANQKIATLFSKKFDFFKDNTHGFKSINLYRTENTNVS